MSESKLTPRHVAIIMDGNGRWAQLRGKERYYGHMQGVEPVRAAVRAAIRAIVAENSDEDDWLSVSTIGNMLVKRQPDFDVRNFGFSKLTQFIQALGMFEVRIVRKKDNTRQAYVREK